jgi:hypothetical protein
MYRKCGLCSYVSEVKRDQSYRCEKCQNSKEENSVVFPSSAATRFLTQADAHIYDLDDVSGQYDLYHFEGLETTALFLCTAYEVMLESTISEVLNSMKTPEIVSELLLNSNQGQDRMGKILASLLNTNKSIKSVFKQINCEDFHDKLHEIIKARNSYIHGNHRAFKDSDIVAEDLKFVADSMIDVFIAINNSYLYKEKR